MRIPQRLEVVGVVNVRISAELDGQPIDVEVDSGLASLRVGETSWLQLHINQSQLILNFHPALAKKLIGTAGRVAGWAWLIRKTPAFFKAMQQLSNQAEAEIVIKLDGHPLASISPHSRPSFNPLGLKHLWG